MMTQSRSRVGVALALMVMVAAAIAPLPAQQRSPAPIQQVRVTGDSTRPPDTHVPAGNIINNLGPDDFTGQFGQWSDVSLVGDRSLGIASALGLVLFPAHAQPLSDHTFYIHDLGHRCLDFGPQASLASGGPVYVYSCNGTFAQQVRVVELDESHDVQLRVQHFDFCIGVRGGQVMVGKPIELQPCDRASPAQRFAVDGDAILMGGQGSGRKVSRTFVIEPQHDYSVLRTPFVVGTREVTEAEYFRFEAVDKSNTRPTSGFITVSTESGLNQALTRGWGTVIEIDPRIPLELKGPFPKEITAGITLRGYRKYLDQGPEVFSCAAITVEGDNIRTMFRVQQDDVRVTGFRVHGHLNDARCSPMTREEAAVFLVLQAVLPNAVTPGRDPRVIFDHLDIGYYHGAAIDVRGPDNDVTQACPPPGSLPLPRDMPVKAIGNFLHHTDIGYGVAVGWSGFLLAEANVFYGIRAHELTSDGNAKSGYAAYDNLALTKTKPTVVDFDMHGSCCCKTDTPSCHWQGDNSGDYFDIGWNTFMPSNHANVNQRGTPCRSTAIHDNVLTHQKWQDAFTTSSTKPQLMYRNQFGTKSPFGDLAVGDFDGDDIDDVFVGTGAAWYYSSGGQSEWRFLNRRPEHAKSLRFGDFDGDGRTDIIALHGSNIDTSWGGVSPWQTINATPWALSDLAVGDFDGDGRADLFLATGTQWFYAPGGRNWAPLALSRYRTQELRFGDFTHQGRAQALRIFHGRWQVAGLGLSWANIGPAAPVNSVAALVVADFDGNGVADVARTNTQTDVWEYTTPKITAIWTPLRVDATSISLHPIGRFNADRTSDVLFWNGLNFSYAPSGHDPWQPLSRQEMR